MTFSIVAADGSGGVGFAIASCCWDAGAVCAAKRGVGAIASQANGNVGFHRVFFEHGGAGLDGVMRRIRESDPDIETRQVGMATVSGERLAFTGAKVSSMFRERTGEGYSCQGNTLASERVVDCMADAFEHTPGPLLLRLLAALQAGDGAGGDARGRQSARLYVAGGPLGEVDIRIEDGPDPVCEIGRIVGAGMELLETLSIFGEFGAAADRAEVVRRAKAFMEPRREPKHVDSWTQLGEMCDAIGDAEGSARALRVVLEIAPGMRPNLVADAKRGLLTKTWTERLAQGQER